MVIPILFHKIRSYIWLSLVYSGKNYHKFFGDPIFFVLRPRARKDERQEKDSYPLFASLLFCVFFCVCVCMFFFILVPFVLIQYKYKYLACTFFVCLIFI